MNKVRRIDPACRPPRSQPIPYKPGKVVVQMVVYLPSLLTQMQVLASFLKGGSEDTLSVSGRIRKDPQKSQNHCSAADLRFWVVRAHPLGARSSHCG